MIPRGHLLVAYDYGEGTQWALVRAASREEVETAYPELFILDQSPESMTAAELASLPHLDIASPSGLLSDLPIFRDVEEKQRHLTARHWPEFPRLGRRPGSNH